MYVFMLGSGERKLQAYWDLELCSLLSLSAPLVSIFAPASEQEAVQSASAFIDYALTWIDQQLEDPQKFPNHLGELVGGGGFCLIRLFTRWRYWRGL